MKFLATSWCAAGRRAPRPREVVRTAGLFLVLLALMGCSNEVSRQVCRDDADCGPGRLCAGGACVNGTLDTAPDDAAIDQRDADGASDGQDLAETDVVSTNCDGCREGEACCDGRCVDLASSVAHCGRCRASCLTAPQIGAGSCVDGHCAIDACAPDWGNCDAAAATGCETALNSRQHCGACGVACGDGELCDGGECVCGALRGSSGPACPAGYGCCGGACVPPSTPGCSCVGCDATETCCSGTCIDTSGDGAHCGACGNSCAPGQSCRDGSCGCVAGQLGDDANCGVCGAACVAGSHCVAGACACAGGGQVGDDDHCGACDVACGPQETCVGGRCVCRVGQLGDDLNCGSCGAACGIGETCRSGVCACATGVLGDDRNCGVCGRACGAGERCAQGVCGCLPGFTDCGAGCVDLESNPAHCGGCGNVCSSSASSTTGVCVGGRCETGCVAGFGDCDGWGWNGCETAFSSPNSCGADCPTAVYCGWQQSCDASGPVCRCQNGSRCQPGERCTDAGCRCGSGAACAAGDWCCPDFFGRTCVDVLNDDLNCGGCGVECTTNTSCMGGRCL